MGEYPDEAYKDEEVLRELYLEKDNSLTEVADILGVSYPTVYRYYERYGFEKDAEYRFKRKFKRDDSGCWLWTAATDKDGYGVHSDDNDNYIRAHRFSYQVYKGNIPDGDFVLHECHNPGCVNPDHLYTGDHMDNMQDAKEHGVSYATDKQREKVRKLTKGQVVEIRNRYQGEDVSMPDLASEYGVHNVTIFDLLHGETWADVEGPTLD